MALGAAFGIVVTACAALALIGVLGRERARAGAFAADRTMRESQLLREALKSLRDAKLPPGARVGLVNPSPQAHSVLASSGDAVVTSYTPLAAALHGDLATRLFAPGITLLGVSDTIPPAWEDAALFIYHDDGSLRPIGHGAEALVEAAQLALRGERYALAERMLLRARALGDTLPAGTFGLIAAAGMQGHPDEAGHYAEEFLRRWPNDPRAATVRQALKGPAPQSP